MNAEFEQVKEIFLAALERATPDAREAYLSQACAAHEPLRRQVDALLHRHEQAGSFLESPPSDLPSPGEEGEGPAGAATFGEPITERPGAVIGPYKLLEQIGEGGFGAVFVAEQQQPLRRRVALKVIKPGMGSVKWVRV